MTATAAATVCLSAAAAPARAQEIDLLAGRRTVFLGDSITQAGGYVSYLSYYLERLHPRKGFDIINLGLSSETLSGLSENGHAGGAFPRPCLFERLGRLLERAKPEVVVACYGMNDGIYLPLDPERFDRFKKGVARLVEDCKAAGVKDIVLVTPPIYDAAPKAGEVDYEAVLAEYAAWETTLKLPGVRVIDLHTAMRKARDARGEPFSKDRVHPGDEGHLLMARTLLSALGVKAPEETAAQIKADPLFRLVDKRRKLRSDRWMRHVGYTREKTVAPEPLGDAEEEAAKLQGEIDALRRGPGK
jgi:lysophospholipase L1-like esterase